MNIYWIFITLFLFCIYILFGLHVTKELDTLSQIILTWVVYTILWITAINIFTLGYFWSVIMKKTGPPGIRGPIGEMGKVGMDGACNISEAKLHGMKTLNDYINNLYKAKTNTDILNIDTQTFPCRYLNEKIQSLAGSKQYNVIIADLSNENKGIDNLVNYLKSIWKTWFELLYNATSSPGIWFTDVYGDEVGGSDYEWVGNNPFDEIKKYDIYYWGITRDFRPLKAELCRSGITHADSKFPKHQLPQTVDKQVQRLKVIETNDYYYVGNTFTHDNNQAGSWWSPNIQNVGGETYYPVGDIMAIGSNNPTKKDKTIVGDNSWDGKNNGPDMRTILVAGDVVDPIDYKDSSGFYTHDNVNLYSPICPEGYTGIGDVATSDKLGQKLNTVKCLPTECVEEIAPGPIHRRKNDRNQWNRFNKWFEWLKIFPGYSFTWYQNVNVLNPWDTGDKEPNTKNGYNLVRGSESEGRNGKPWYKLKKSCMVKVPNRELPPLPDYPVAGTKEVEEINAELGIGWYGHPYKLDPKYSFFTFLNIVPEGMIVNQGTGQRFYIIHKEGLDINLFNILAYNNNTAKFNGSLQINLNQIDDPNDLNLPNNKDYPNNSNIPPTIVNPEEPTPEPVEYNPPPKRIIITKLDKTNINQQWKIMLSADKKIFKMKSMYDGTYLIVTQEPREGLVEFSSIDIDNYNYLNDPAFRTIDRYELENRTNFTFISSFGPQLDIIDNDDNNTTNQ
jgi:hypothetical protein